MTQIILVIISVLVYISSCSEHQENLVDDEPLPDYYAILKVLFWVMIFLSYPPPPPPLLAV